MATTDNGRNIEITSLSSNFDHGKVERFASISFSPGAANDELVVRDGSASGPTIFHVICSAATDQRVKYLHGQACQPYINFSECTLSAGHKILLSRWPHKR